jgi:hypothetical protein
MDNNEGRRFDRAKKRRVGQDTGEKGYQTLAQRCLAPGPACMNTHLPVEELIAEDAQAPHIDV